jgi:hypothetical protein
MKRYLLAVAALVAGLASVLLAQTPGGQPRLTVEDRLEIQELYARYALMIDSGDAEGWANTFTPDGVFNNSSRGHDALVQFVHDWRANRNGANRRHWYNNLILTPTAAGVRASVYMILLDVGTRPPAPVNSYLYDDALVRTAGGWRFQSRVLKSDLPPATPGSRP